MGFWLTEKKRRGRKLLLSGGGEGGEMVEKWGPFGAG